MKYRRFVDAAGGWARCRRFSTALDTIAQEARRFDRQRGDALGARSSGGRGRDRRRATRRDATIATTISRLFSFALDDDDRAPIDAALAATTPLPAIAATNTAGRRFSPPRAI